MNRWLILAQTLILMTIISNPEQLSAQQDVQHATDNLVKAADPGDRNNNFYDNVDLYELPLQKLVIDGEVSNPGPVDFAQFQLRTVIVREAYLKDDGKNSFTGAYRYDGYSLFDILQDRILAKRNKEQFPPIIDLYVIIENEKGEKVVLSWGEIYYPGHLHQVLLASRVGRIVPSKTKELWPLPSQSKLVVVNDLLTERNLSNPVRITVRSLSREIPVNRDLDPLFAPSFRLTRGGKVLQEITELPRNLQPHTYNAIFYGRGRGIHSTTPFNGPAVRDIVAVHAPQDKTLLRQGLVTVIGLDGYRAAYSYSEIMNRSDQQELLLIQGSTDDNSGKFRVFPAGDFFSDRAVKAVTEIEILNINQ